MDENTIPSHLSRFLSLLTGVRRQGTGWVAACPCPGHGGGGGDRNPSLAIKLGVDNRVLVNCRVGCVPEEVLHSIGLDWTDLFPNSGSEPPPVPVCSARPPGGTAVERHAAYSAVLGALSLSQRHRDDLRQRGLDDAAIDRNMYRSLRNTDRGAVARAAVQSLGDRAYTVPGIVPGEHGPTLYGNATGMLIPVRDTAGQIVALKIRRPAPATPKYQYLSGPDDAPGPGSPVHVPMGISVGSPVVRVTEGELKADVAAARTGIPTIGVPGVTQWADAMPMLAGVGTVVVSFDAPDVLTKVPVREQVCRFVEALRAAGHAVELETWDPPHKGIDDLLTAGNQPRRLAGSEFEQFLESGITPTIAAVVGMTATNTTVNTATANAAPAIETVSRAPFPTDVFPGPLADYAQKVAAALGCPIDYAAVAMLAVASAAIGLARSINVKGNWFERAGLYAVVVGNPSTAKSPALKTVLKPLFEEQERLYADHTAARRRYEEELEQHTRGAKQARGEDEPPAKPVPPPPLRQLFVNDATVEALAVTLQRNPKGVLVFRDELTAWVRSMDAYRGKGADTQFYLSAWSNEFVKVDRRLRIDDPVVVPRPFLSVLGGIQPDVLPELDLQRGRQDGFIPRLLFAYPATGGARRWTSTQVDEDDEEPWRLAVGWLLNLQPVTPEGSGPHPRALSFAPEALAEFAGFYNQLADEMDAIDFPPHLLGVYGKMQGYTARFALILHLLRVATDPLAPGRAEGPIGVDDVRGAARLARYFLAHARAVHSALRRSTDDRGVEELLAWLRRTGRGGCTARDLSRHGVARVKNTSEAMKLMREAADRGHGMIEVAVPTSGSSGSRAPRFRLTAPVPPDTPDRL